MLVCWGYPCRGATEYAPPGATIGGEYTYPAFIHSGPEARWFVGADTRAPRGFAPGYGPAALQAAPGTSHSGPVARLGGVCNTPRGFAAQGFALGYGPAALQAAPASIHSGPRARLGGVCNTPLP